LAALTSLEEHTILLCTDQITHHNHSSQAPVFVGEYQGVVHQQENWVAFIDLTTGMMKMMATTHGMETLLNRCNLK